MQTERLTPLQAAQKIRHYCAYQERCHSEVRRKLYEYGLNPTEVDEIVSELIAENYLNEARFASQYAGGHFRVKKWGRVRIRKELELRKVSPYNIKAALAEIEDTDYEATASRLIDTKRRELGTKGHPAVRKQKVISYMLQKGYEMEVVLRLME